MLQQDLDAILSEISIFRTSVLENANNLHKIASLLKLMSAQLLFSHVFAYHIEVN